MSHRQNCVVLKMTRAFPPRLQAHLLGTATCHQGVDEYCALLERFWAQDANSAEPGLGFGYALFTPVELYWGFAKEDRARWTGYVGRAYEHFFDIARARRDRATSEQKYVIFSKYDSHDTYFVPQFAGDSASAYARERLAIRLVPTRSNRKEKRPNHIPPRLGRHDSKRKRKQQHRLSGESLEQRACRLNSTFLTYISDEERVREDLAWTHLTYGQFDSVLQNAQAQVSVTEPRPLAGPHHLCAEENTRLLVLYLAHAGREKLPPTPRSCAKSVWLAAADLAEFLPRAALRQSAAIRLQWCLSRFGVQWGGNHRVHRTARAYPSPIDPITCRRCPRPLGEHPATTAYVMRKLVVSRVKPPAVHKQGRQHRVLARKFDRSQALSIPIAERQEFLEGKSIFLVRENLGIPLPNREPEIEKATMSLAYGVPKALSAKYLRAPLLRSLLPPIRHRLSLPPTWATGEVLQLWTKLPPRDSDVIVTQGGEVAKAGLLMHKGCLFSWTDHIFWHGDTHIEHLQMTPDQLRYKLYLLHMVHLDEEFWVRDYKRRQAADVADYLQFKAKCFEENHRVCEKPLTDPSHKCCRRISSYRLPTCYVERTAARAIECLRPHDGLGPASAEVVAGKKDPTHFQTWTVDDFIVAIRAGLENLRFEPAFLDCCIECSQLKPLVSPSHGDASATFDEILETETASSFDKMSRRVEPSTQKYGVSIVGGRKHYALRSGEKGDLTRRPFRVRSRAVQYVKFLHDRKCRKVLVYSGQTNYSRIGRHIFRRRKGVTMGGPLSPAKAGLVYRQRERVFLRGPRRWADWHLSALQRPAVRLSDFCFAARIADDGVAASSAHCPSCSGKKLSAVYTAPLVHKSEEEGATIKAVDVCIERVGPSFKITRLNRNMAFIFGMSHPLRTRFLPPLRAPTRYVAHESGLARGATGPRPPARAACDSPHVSGVSPVLRAPPSGARRDGRFQAPARDLAPRTARCLSLIHI